MRGFSVEKVDDTTVQELDAVKDDAELLDTRPEILRDLSKDDMASMEKKLLRKLDIRLLPSKVCPRECLRRQNEERKESSLVSMLTVLASMTEDYDMHTMARPIQET